METFEKKVIKDYNNAELERQKTLNRRLQRKLDKREKSTYRDNQLAGKSHNKLRFLR
jgi:hypothetical protein